MNFPSLPTQQRIAELREKARANSLTQDECREAIRFLRAERLAMPQKPASKAKPAPNADDLLSELGI
jgi:hypothetical protein